MYCKKKNCLIKSTRVISKVETSAVGSVILVPSKSRTRRLGDLESPTTIQLAA